MRAGIALMRSRWYELLLIREDERPTVLYFVALIAVLGAGLAFGRGSADALFFKRYGVEHLPEMYALLGLVLAATSVTYAAYADRLASERLAIVVLAVLAALVAASWWLMVFTAVALAYPIYFLVYQVASDLLVVHVSLYMAQNFDTLQSKRLFPLLFAALEAGRIVGGVLLAAATQLVGPSHLLLPWLALAGVAVVMIRRHHQRAGSSPFYRPPPRRRAPFRRAVEQIVHGVRFTHTSALARAQSGALFFLVVSYYTLSYAINRIYTEHFATEASLTAFLGLLSAVTAAAALLMQLLLAGRLLQRFGLKTVNLIFPITHLLSFGALFAQFALPAALLASFSRDSVMPALRGPTRNLFFNVLPDYMQGRVRALSLGLVLPAGLVLSGAGLLLLRQTDPRVYLAVGSGAAALLLWYSVRSNRAYLSAILDTLKERLFLPGRQLDSAVDGGGEALSAELVRGVESDDEDLCVAYARLLAERFPARAAPAIAARLARASVATRDRLVKLLDARGTAQAADALWRTLDGSDEHYHAKVLVKLMAARDPRAHSTIPKLLAAENPRLLACGVHGLLRFGTAEEQAGALERLRQLLASSDTAALLAGLAVLGQTPRAELADALLPLLEHSDLRVQRAALEVLPAWHPAPWPAAEGAIDRALESSDGAVRAAAVQATWVLDTESRARRLWTALSDPHAVVQRAAIARWRAEPAAAATVTRFLAEGCGDPRAQAAALRILVDRGAPTATFESLARERLADAHTLRRFHQALADSRAEPAARGAALEVLAIALRERHEAALDLALQALEGVEDRATVAVIRAGLHCGERRHRAGAIEALGELRNRALADGLSELLQPTAPSMRQALAAGRATIEEVILWCLGRGDAWLRTCAEQAQRAGA
jgi:hypothetical protein